MSLTGWVKLFQDRHSTGLVWASTESDIVLDTEGLTEAFAFNVNITFIYLNGVDTWCSQKLILFLVTLTLKILAFILTCFSSSISTVPSRFRSMCSQLMRPKLWIFLPSLEKTLELGGWGHQLWGPRLKFEPTSVPLSVPVSSSLSFLIWYATNNSTPCIRIKVSYHKQKPKILVT